MRTHLITFLLLLTALLAGCKQEKKLSEIINSIGIEYAPEKRESVFNISYKRLSSMTYSLNGEVGSPNAKQALLDTLLLSGYKIVDSITVLPHMITKPWGLITLSVANLRATPSHSAELLSQALMGTPVKILKEQNGWAFIQTPDHYLAWCEKIAIAFKDEEEMLRWKKAERVIIQKPLTFILNTETRLNISDAVTGDILEQKERIDEEVLVQLPDGRIGLIPSSDIASFPDWLEQIHAEQQALINKALEYTGIPYLWGGTSPKAMDCSGFVKTVYFLNGTILARDASLQVKYGTSIPKNNGWKEFEPGDLLFFSSIPNGEKITHVGMYLGNSELIHASGLVRVNSLDSTKTNYNKHLYKTMHSVKRIIGAAPNQGIVHIKEHPWYSN